MKHSQTPLLLEGYVFPSIAIYANPDFEAIKERNGNDIDTEIDVKVLQNINDTTDYKLQLSIEISSEGTDDIPYSIEILAVGTFIVNDMFPEENRKDLVAVTGSSILYGSARELVLTMTGRSPWGPFQLPTKSFLDLKGNLTQASPAAATKKKATTKKKVVIKKKVTIKKKATTKKTA